MKCETCSIEPASFAWTDTHGIAQCTTCGTPYMLIHYEGEQGSPDRRRVKKPAESIVDETWKPILRQYWEECKRIIPSGCSFPGGQELATNADHRAFSDWCTAHEEIIPKREE